MTLNQINNKIAEICTYLDQWEAQGYTPTIEKQSVLHKLQEVYDALSNSKAVPTDCPEGVCLDANFAPLQQPQQVFVNIPMSPLGACEQKIEQTQHSVEPQELAVVAAPVALILPNEVGNEVKNETKTTQALPNSDIVLILGQTISVEQKNAYMNELFWRDEAFFANEIRKFQQTATFDDALIYIGEKYNWSANNMHAEQFISLLENYYK